MSAIEIQGGASQRGGASSDLAADRADLSRPARDGLGTQIASCAVGLEEFGHLTPISRLGGQGRVYRPTRTPPNLAAAPVVVKLYRRSQPATAARILVEMAMWRRSLAPQQLVQLERVTAWPLAVIDAGGLPVGIAMRDLSGRYGVPFLMPSGRREQVLLALEHLLGEDAFLQLRGLDVRLDTITRARVAERVSAALAFLHRHAIVASDIAPNNLLVSFAAGRVEVCFIDCDSMAFRGSQALASVETSDWEIPAPFGQEPAHARATDAYKLGLIVLRLFARSHDARAIAPQLKHVPAELRSLLSRALAADRTNRPPAGEWQRALRQLLAVGNGVNERYPGPPPRQPIARSTAVPLQPDWRRPVAARPHRSLAARPQRSAAARSHGGPSPALRRAVVVMWLVTGTVVLFLVLSRLFAAAVPAQDNGGGGAGFSGGSGGRGPYPYRYYYPSVGADQGGPGQGSQFP